PRLARRGGSIIDYESWETNGVTEPEINFSRLQSLYTPILFGGISIMIVGVLSRFNKGASSTSMERGFTMSWLLIGMLMGIVSKGIDSYLFALGGSAALLTKTRPDSYQLFIADDNFCAVLWVGCLFGVFLLPALGGFIMVGKMIMEFG